jgi:UDP-N-acetylmuramoyl-L-alanyl-D-glutamate--2,6-diaminopimelate ligase
MASYRRCKARLVELVVPDGILVVNADDPAWADLELRGRSRITFGIEQDADLRATGLELGPGGATFDLHADDRVWRARTPLVGRYNVENALAALAVGRAAGLGMDELLERLAEAPPVSGRLEAVVSEPFTVLIDFAHTPDALRNALAAVRPLTSGRLIVVFGAGGDRDPTKRRPMAEAVRDVADVIVLTSDNPRTEDPDAIIDDVASGLEGIDHLRFADRREAIAAAVDLARPDDTIVLAGKGHESYQVIGTEKRPFDERAIVRDALRTRGAA